MFGYLRAASSQTWDVSLRREERAISARLNWLDSSGGRMKDREFPDTISRYVSFRVWLVFFHPVPSHKTSRFAHLYPEVRVQYGNIHVRNQTKGTIMTSENSQNLVHYLKRYALNMLRPHPSLSAARISTSTSIPNDLVQEQAEPRTVAGSAPNHRPIVHRNIHTIPRGMGDHWVVNAVIFA